MAATKVTVIIERIYSNKKGEILYKVSIDVMEDLAIDFDMSHQYMLEKEGYNQQDIDYAFSLNVKERDNAQSAMFMEYETASDTYISLILEEVFGGMKNRMLADEAKGGLPDNPTAHTLEAVTAWLDGDMSGCVKKNPKKMEMIIRGIKRSVNTANGQKLSKDDIKEKLSEFIENEWVSKIFKRNEQNQKEYTGARIAPMAVGPIVCSGKYAFEKQIDSILETVMKEKEKDQNPAAKNLGRKNKA